MNATSDGWLIVCPAAIGSALSSHARLRSDGGTNCSRGTAATALSTRGSSRRLRREASRSSRSIDVEGTVAGMVPSLWLARHGETAWTLSRQHTGRTDVPLTEHGREQARELAPKLAGVDAGLVLASPLARALETARLAG